MQISIFDGTQQFKIKKPIRLIELFGGYGSQAFALKYLGANFEHWKLCEWAVKSIQAYKDAHFPNDNTDYSKEFSHYQIVKWLLNKGISANYNEPMKERQIIHLGVEKARQIYNNIKATHNLVNIQQVKGEDLEIVDTDKYCYVMTYSFPCQDLSLAGKQKGMEKGSGTRSGMLWEVERILDECDNLPQVLLMENVPEVTGQKNIKHFAKWLEKLESLGYHCYWQVLNAKNYGIPQNRERCFMVSILGDYYYNFPQAKKLEKKLKDLLENSVDEKFYLSEKALMGKLNTNFNCSSLSACMPNKDGIMPTLCARDFKDPKCVQVAQIEGKFESTGRVYSIEGLSPTLNTCGGGNREPKILAENLKTQLCNELLKSGILQENYVVNHSYTNGLNGKNPKSRQKLEDYIETTNNISPTLTTRPDVLGVVVNSATKQGYEIAQDGDSINLAFPNSKTRRGRVGEQVSQTILTNSQIGVVVDDKRKPKCIGGVGEKKSNGGTQYYQQNRIYDDNIAISVTTSFNPYYKDNLRIRKLTPTECFRLMGVKDEDFEKIAENQSNASLYHLAGDSIVIDVLMAIFGEML